MQQSVLIKIKFISFVFDDALLIAPYNNISHILVTMKCYKAETVRCRKKCRYV